MSKRQQTWLFAVATLTAVIWGTVLALSGSVSTTPEVGSMPTLVQLPDDVLQTPALPTEVVGEYVPSQTLADNSDDTRDESIATLTEGESEISASRPNNSFVNNTNVVFSPQTSSSITSTQNVVSVEISQQPIPNTVVLRFTMDTTLAEKEAYVASFGGTITQVIDALNTVIVTVPNNITLETLPASDRVTQSEPDYYVGALSSPMNDPFYSGQWALSAIGVVEAWDALPNNTPIIPVAVIDSGVCLTHPDLEGNLLAGWDFVQNDNTPQDEFGHGCAVSGVIVANRNNSIGIAGVASNASVMPLRVLDAQGVGSYSRVAQAIIYAVDNGAQIINLSLGGSSPSTLLEDAINYAQARNVTLVAAAGNQGANTVMYPAAYDSVIAVGSVDQNLQRSSFSNYGATIDIYAPGRDIVTTTLAGYGYMSGTSLATPYVTGVIALNKALGFSLATGGGLLKVNAPSNPVVVTDTPSEVAGCNVVASANAQNAWLDTIKNQLANPQSVSTTDVQMARQGYLNVTKPCFDAEYAQGLTFDYGGRAINESEPNAQFVTFGTKWGEQSSFASNRPPGIAGGQVTYSFMSSGVSLGINDGTTAEELVSISSLVGQGVSCDFETEIRNAFTYWGAVANIQFIEVTDSGLPFNAPNATGTLRIGAFPIDGSGKELGRAYFPPPDPLKEPVQAAESGTGDIHLDASENWACDPSAGFIDIGLVMQHEIGHAIGLAHQSFNVPALMNPSYNEALIAASPNGLQQDDQDGARAIYGVAGIGTSFARNPRNETLGNNLPTLQWDEVANVSEYNIQLDNNSDFSSPILDISVLDGAEAFTVTAPLSNGTFFWRVRAFNNGWGEWSSRASFGISIAIPTLVKPFNNDNLTLANVSFQWSDVAGDNNLFDLQLSRDAEFTETGIEQTVLGINGTTRVLNALGSGLHYWRVKESNGDWSNAQQFTIDTNVPTLSSPASGSLQTDAIFDFQWAAVPGATEYQFQIDTSPNFVGLLFLDRLFLDRLFLDRLFLDRLFLDRLFLDRLFLDRLFLDRLFLDRLFLDRLFLDRLFLDRLFLDRLFIDKITTNNLTLNKALSEGTHYWRVRARREDGTWSGWSNTNSVTVQTPGRSQVVINEINVGNPSWIEVYNKGNTPVDLSTWKLTAYTPNGLLDLAYDFPVGFTIPANGYVILHEEVGTDTATDLYMGADTIVWPQDTGANALSIEDGEDGETASAEFVLTDNELNLLAELMAASMMSETNTAQALGNPIPASAPQTDNSATQALTIPDTVAQTISNEASVVTASEATIIVPPATNISTSNNVASIEEEPVLQAQGEDEISAQSVIIVNTTDMVSGNDGLCSLIEAINSANTNTASGGIAGECVAGSATDTIELNGSLTYTVNTVNNLLSGANGLPVISSDLVINGNGSIIQRFTQGCVTAPQFRLFLVDTNVNFTLNNVDLKNGCDDSSGGGGAMMIYSNATVTLNRVAFGANVSTGRGGAIFISDGANVTIENNSSFESNQAGDKGGAIFNSQATLTIRNTTFDVNSADVGGGAIYQLSNTANSTTDIRQSEVNSNSAPYAGGLLIVQTGAGGTSSLTVSEVTIQNNIANSGEGGGINVDGAAEVVINASTISGNNASSGIGGGFYSENGILSAVNVTIADNSAGDGAGFAASGGTIIFSNSTIAYNTAASGNAILMPTGLLFVKNMIIANPTSSFNCDSGVSSAEGVNFITDTSCGTTATLLANLSLDVLEDNGGLTRTNAITGGSVAIDAASSCTSALGGTPIITDQRGVGRPIGTQCDAGAFETTANDAAQTTPNFTVNTTLVTNDGVCGTSHCSIIEAINAANSNVDSSTITLGSSQTYTLSTINNVNNGNNGLPQVTTNIVMIGNGSIIERFTAGCATSPQFRLFAVSSAGELTLDTMTVRNGCDNTSNGGGAVYANLGNLNVTNVTFDNNIANSNGGALGISNNTTALNAVVFTNNAALAGIGGAINSYQASIVIVGSTFSNNAANSDSGGAIASAANDFSADVTITNSTFNNNSAANGGAIYASETGDGGIGILTLIGSTVLRANSALTLGGAIHAINSDIIIDPNVVIGGNNPSDGNLADRGGGIYLFNSVLDMTNATVRYNVSDFANGGGGILAESGSTVNITDSTLSNNRADSGEGGALKLDGVGTTATINETTFRDNVASSLGGAILNVGASNLIIRRSTFATNSADDGAAIYSANATATLINSTFSGNSATGEGTIYVAPSATVNMQYITLTQSTNIGLYTRLGSTSRIVSSIVADQTSGANCFIGGSFSAGGIDASFADDNTCIFFIETATPLIDPVLQNNGGTTETHALAVGSPAIDSQTDGCDDVDFELVSIDQRGATRPNGAFCDAGAFEAVGDTAQTTPNFTVNTTNMTDDGVCGISNCTLIEAINASNANVDASIITLTNGTYLPAVANNTTTGSNAFPEITTDISIIGSGSTITRNIVGCNAPQFRFFIVDTVGRLNLDNLTLTGGCDNTSFGAAAVYTDGSASLELNNVILTNNEVVGQDGGAIGGFGNVTLTNSIINDNIGRGILSYDGEVSISNSTISNNISTSGGGIFIEKNLTMVNTTISNNTTTQNEGGGIFIGSSGTGSTISNSTISGNIAQTNGGGIFTYAPLIITNSTISENTALGGGAIYVNNGTTLLSNSTLSGNVTSSGIGGAVLVDTSGTLRMQYVTIAQSVNGALTTNGTVDIVSSIIAAQSSGANCSFLAGTFAAGGINVSFADDGTCPGFTQTALPLINTTLANNGGNTQTHALVAGSPAIDAETGALGCDSVGFDTPTTDQRGVARPQGAFCDAGAFEATTANIFTVNSIADTNDGTCDATNCTLREAIIAANSTPNTTSADEIHFNIAGVGVQTIVLAGVLPNITDPVVIDGYTQPGTSVNTLPTSDNAVLLIELSGENVGAGGYGLRLNVGANGSIVRGLVVNRFNLYGIHVAGASNVQITGNFIGTDPSGTLARPNGSGDNTSGIRVVSAANTIIGGTTPSARNIISGNLGEGISVWEAATTNTLIYGNFIGVAADGVSALGNSAPSTGAGVNIRNNAVNTTIGGINAGEGNIIAYNSPYGIVFYTDVLMTVRGNSIYNNAQLGIDFGTNGINPNDIPDVNSPTNFPIITSVNSTGGSTQIFGTFQSEANLTYDLDFYSNTACDVLGNGEGQTYLGTASVALDGSGSANLNLILLQNIPAGTIITATANDPSGGTSEFSPCVTSTAEDLQTAPVYNVNTVSSIGDGVCGISHCSIIDAINASNADGVVSTINLANGANYILSDVDNASGDNINGLPLITTEMIINGQDATIRRSSETSPFRFFHIVTNGNLTLNNVTLTNGSIGGVLAGSAIFNEAGTVTLNNVAVTGNINIYAIYNYATFTINSSNISNNAGGVWNASSGGVITINNSTINNNVSSFYGGGINNYGTLIMTGGTIANNTTTGQGGGLQNEPNANVTLTNVTIDQNSAPDAGGGIGNYGTLTITGGSITNNTANIGGGVYNVKTATIDTVTVTGNSAIDGGGIMSGGNGNITIRNSFIGANIATEDGAGLYNGVVEDFLAAGGGGTMTVINTTIAQNNASLTGGGLLNENGGIVNISSSTIASNGDIDAIGGGIRVAAVGGEVVTLKNTLLAFNFGGDCSQTAPSIVSQGVNFATDNTCTSSGVTEVVADDLYIGALANNGGATPTIALGEFSIAIDAVSDCTLIGGGNVLRDQRGVSRPQGAACDIGAFESSNSPLGTVGGSVALVQGVSAVDYVRFGDTFFAAPIGTNWTGETVYLPLAGKTIGRDPNSSDSDDRIDWGSQKATLGGQNEVYVVINEIFTGTQDAVEIANANIETAKLGGWTLTFYNPEGLVDATYTFPADFTMLPNSYVTLYETAGTNTNTEIFINTPISWSSWNGVGAVTLTNSIGAGVDYVRFGDSGVVEQTVSNLLTNDDPDPQPMGALNVSSVVVPRGTTWNGTSPISPLPNQSLGRDSNSTDLDLGSDWFAASESLGEVNPITRPAPNDLIPQLTIITSVPFRDTQSTTAATRTPDEPLVSCSINVGYTLWYRYTATESGVLRFQTDGSDFDTVLAIYDTALTELACNDNHGTDTRSRLDFNMVAGQNYIIMAGGNLNASGNLTFSVKPPFNDNFSDPIAIETTPFSDSQDTTAASHTITDPTPSCSTSVGRSVWYSFTATTNDKLELTTIGSDFDTNLSVWTGTAESLVEVVCNDDGGNNTTSSIEFIPVAGTTYAIMASGNQDAGGNLVFQSKLIVTPDNDLIANATVVDLPYTRTQETIGATVSVDDPTFACGVNVGKTVWYQYTATTDATVIFDTLDSGFDTVMAIYTGTPNALTPVACNDDATVGKGSSIELVAPTIGNIYYIAVGGYQNASGNLVFKAQAVGIAPENDEIANAFVTEGLPYTFSQDTTGASVTLGDPVSGCTTNIGKTVWYRYDAVGSKTLKITTEGANYDTFIAVWANINNALVELGCNNDAGTSLQSQLLVSTGDNTSLYIMVAGYGSTSGNLVIKVEEAVNNAVNDTFANAKIINPLPYTDSQSTALATNANDDPVATCGLQVGRTVWYQYTATSNAGILRFNTLGSDFDTVLSVWTGTQGNLTPVVCNDNDGANITSAVEVFPTIGATYYLMVGGNNGALGQVVLNAELVPPPSNDQIENATPLSTGQVVTLNAITPIDTRGATLANSDPVLECNATIGKTVWYTLTVEDFGTLNLTTDGSNFNTVLAIFSGSPSSLNLIACDDNSVNNLTSRIQGLTLNQGIYYVMVGGSFAEGGLLNLNAELISTPANDLITGAVAISSTPYEFTQNTQGATQSVDDPAVCGTTSNNTVWFTYVADSYGVLDITFVGTTFNEIATIFTGTAGSLTKVACETDDKISLSVVPNETYTIMVGDIDNVGGTLSIQATLSAPLVSLEVTQTSNPISIPELGGEFTFTAVIKNTSPVNSVTLTSVVDNVYGDIGASCLPALGTLLAPDATAICTYTGSITGQPGQLNINQVTATGVADNSAPVSATGSLRVEITDVPASMTVAVVPNVANVPTPSGNVTYTVTIQNTSVTDAITIESLASDVYGAVTSCNTALPATLALNGTLTCTYSGLASGATGLEVTNSVTVNAIDDDGTTLTASGSATVTMGLPNVANGLFGQYFNNADLTAPVLTRIDPTIDFNWRNGSPDPLIDNNTFSVRWTGQVQAQYTETYTFQTITNDGVRLWVNGQQLINYWNSYGEVWKTGSIALVAGQRYDIRMEFYENTGNAMARLRWFSPSTPRQVIPTSALFALSAPIANAGVDQTLPADVSNSALVTLDGSASSDDGTITNYSWSLNNSVIATGVNPQVSLPVGTHVVTLTVTDNTLQTTSDTVTINVTPYGSGGLFATYFNNADLTAPVFTRIDPTIDFNWGNGSPAPSIDNNTFSVRWTGQVLAQYTETYTFQTITNDGVRLWVNGQQLINYWKSDGEVWKTGTIALVAGQRYNIVMEFYENTGNAMARLRWFSPSTPREVIPASFLYFFSAPIANAGADQNVNADNTNSALVTLNGAGSTDNGTITNYSWSLNNTEIATGVNPQVNLPVGAHVITLTVTDNDGQTASDTVIITVSSFGATGLIGQYFNNRDLTAPVLTRLDATVDFNWAKGSPDSSIGNDTFSVRWTGEVQANFSETYTFYTVGDDGIRLWVNGQQLVNDWRNHSATERQGTITLLAGQRYDIVMEYYENQGRAVARLLWSSPSTPKQVIPMGNLFNDGSLALSLSASSDQNSGSLIPYSSEATEAPVEDMGAQTITTPVTIGVYQDGIWSFGDSENNALANMSINFGAGAGWTAFIGDFNGDGADGLGLYKDGTWILRDITGDTIFTFGANEAGWTPVIGDWNGDNTETVGLYKDGVWLLRNSNSAGDADMIVNFGTTESGWTPVSGDWNGDTSETLGLYKDGTWQLTNSLTDLNSVMTFTFGPIESGWTALAGDWNNDGVDSVGLAKDNIWRLSNDNSTVALGFAFGEPVSTGFAIAPYRGGIAVLSLIAQQGTVVLPTATPTVISETATPIVITEVPTETAQPTEIVTEVPTQIATEVPTEMPTVTETPTEIATEVPTEAPVVTEVPTEAPTEALTATETEAP